MDAGVYGFTAATYGDKPGVASASAKPITNHVLGSTGVVHSPSVSRSSKCARPNEMDTANTASMAACMRNAHSCILMARELIGRGIAFMCICTLILGGEAHVRYNSICIQVCRVMSSSSVAAFNVPFHRISVLMCVFCA